MKFKIIKSHAKINLALNIVGKSKNLHKIESLIAFVNLYDEILIKEIKSKSHKVTFSGKFSKKIGKNNSISKLLKLLDKNQLINNKKFYIKVNKKIPSKAGLGGGSMNAASILSFFTKKKIISIKKKRLIEISKLIGSDVVLGLNKKNLILNSKNQIKSFSNCKKIHILIAKPNFGCSTKVIYSLVKKFNKPLFNKPRKNMFKLNFLKKMNNDLEPLALERYSKLKSIKHYLEHLSKPDFVRMTGSGSAFVGYFQSKHRCDKAKKQFNKKYKNYWCITSKTI